MGCFVFGAETFSSPCRPTTDLFTDIVRCSTSRSLHSRAEVIPCAGRRSAGPGTSSVSAGWSAVPAGYRRCWGSGVFQEVGVLILGILPELRPALCHPAPLLNRTARSWLPWPRSRPAAYPWGPQFGIRPALPESFCSGPTRSAGPRDVQHCRHLGDRQHDRQLLYRCKATLFHFIRSL